MHRDAGLADTKVPGEKLADLELRASDQFLRVPGKLLDLGCGGGRATVYFATKGYNTVGIDMDLDTLRTAKKFAAEHGADLCEFVLADARELCFRDSGFDCVISFGSTLSEKFRVWLSKRDRESIVTEALRVTESGGTALFNFVHRYWNLRGLIKFLRYHGACVEKKLRGKRAEWGDYWEIIGNKKISFHAFTIREARSLFPSRGIWLRTWKRKGWLFTDWFFVAAKKV
jgi:SAM-dependent methyltransferase